MKNENLLLIFTKHPEAGKVKTRLAKDIGDEKALQIYKLLLEHSRSVTAGINAVKQVHYAGNIIENDLWDKETYIKKSQQGKDLGDRMLNAFKNGFEEGFQNIVIIGTDLVDITSNDIDLAFSVLKNKNFVIGPANDGGYYLLGMNSLNSEVFKNKKWSSSSVFSNTMQDLKGKSLALLPMRKDADVLEDIADEPAFQKILKE